MLLSFSAEIGRRRHLRARGRTGWVYTSFEEKSQADVIDYWYVGGGTWGKCKPLKYFGCLDELILHLLVYSFEDNSTLEGILSEQIIPAVKMERFSTWNTFGHTLPPL